MTPTEIKEVLEASALQAAAPIALALMECDELLRAEAVELFRQLAGGQLDEGERYATTALLRAILFPDADGIPGLDLAEAEASAREQVPGDQAVLESMDQQETTFAERLRGQMGAQGVTEEELAQRVGIGRPVLALILQGVCRPQRQTVRRFAQALAIPPEALWPDLGS